MLFVVLCPGTPEGSTGSGSGFKASQKTGQRLKVSSDRLGEAGNRTCDPWFTRHRFIPYTTAAYYLVFCDSHLYQVLCYFLFLDIKKILFHWTNNLHIETKSTLLFITKKSENRQLFYRRNNNGMTLVP